MKDEVGEEAAGKREAVAGIERAGGTEIEFVR
jgi:hypothetical protein